MEVAESFFGSFKTERVFDAGYRSRDDARRDIIDYIEMFYNSNRRHSYLGYLSPGEFEKRMALKKAALKMSIFTGPHQDYPEQRSHR